MWDGLTVWCKVVQTTEAATDTVGEGDRFWDILITFLSLSPLFHLSGRVSVQVSSHVTKLGTRQKYIESRKTCAHDLSFSRHLNSLCSQLGWHRLNSIAGNSQESEGYGEVKTVRCSLLNRSAAVMMLCILLQHKSLKKEISKALFKQDTEK